jgi:hypothetical protein
MPDKAFSARTVRAYHEKQENIITLLFMNDSGPHEVKLPWDQLGNLTDQLLVIQTSPRRRMQLQLAGPADYILPVSREYVGLTPPADEREARIRLSITPGTTLDIPLSRNSLIALAADLEAHLQKHT